MKQVNLTEREINRLKRYFIQGMSERDAAALIKVHSGTIANWFVRFNQEGVTPYSEIQQRYICKGLFVSPFEHC